MFRKIACFNTKNEYLPDELGDFRDKVKRNKHHEVIYRCAEIAFDKNYKFFALGYNGRCRSGANAQHEYHKVSSANEQKCPHGIGRDKRIAVYTFGELL